MAYDLKAKISLVDDFTRPMQGIMRAFDDVERQMRQVDNLWGTIERSATQATTQIRQFGDETRQSGERTGDLQDQLERARQEAERLGDAGGDVGGRLNDAGRAGERAAGNISSAFRKAAGVIATVLAVDQIKDFTVGLVESAADATAMNAQYEQVFGDIQGTANKTIGAMSKEFNMVPNRLKPALTSMTSMFQGLGLEGEDALSAAERGVRMSADAAAFFDVAYEDANGSLNSFIKGNYEGGEAIGLFGKETQLAAYASEQLGLDWKTLDEAGKQLARTSFAEQMMLNAKITGQAAKESEGYQNVLGNMQQAWIDLKGIVGIPIMEVAIDGMSKLSGWLQKVDGKKLADGLGTAGAYMTDTFGPVLGEVKEDLQALWGVLSGDGVASGLENAFTDLKTGMTWISDNWEEVRDGVVVLAGAFTAYKLAVAGLAIYGLINGLMASYALVAGTTTVAQWALNAAMAANPISLVALAIAGLVGAGILLYQNWDIVREKTEALWSKLGAFQGVATAVLGPLGFIIRAAVTMADNWDSTRSIWENIWSGIKIAAENSINDVVASINWMIDTINKIPGVNIPIVPKVDWSGYQSAPSSSTKNTMSYAEAVNGSHATGLERVPFDSYTAELHKDEAVLTAGQANTLRGIGALKSSAGKPVLDTSPLAGQRTGTGKSVTRGQAKKGMNFTFGDIHINGANKSTKEMAKELVDELKYVISAGALA